SGSSPTRGGSSRTRSTARRSPSGTRCATSPAPGCSTCPRPRKRRLSSSSESGRSGPEPAGQLPYDAAVPYAVQADGRLLPRLRMGIVFFQAQPRAFWAAPLLDTGAEMSAFDGSLAVQAGWSMDEVVGRAVDVRPLFGVGL